ncbi:MAG: FHA domain-containing protein [Candidatus Eremiobacteraeota bacterium]|nr:FHA domain-containing protein [Candidatus Eremiobacteraeota bacterium]
MKCPECGAENLEGAAYCEDCGSKLPVGSAAPPPAAGIPPVQPPVVEQAPPVVTAGGMMKCGSCGAENPAGEAYCEDCGAGLGAPAAVPAGGDAPQQVISAPPPVATAKAKITVLANSKEFLLNKDVITIGRRSPADGIYPDVDLTDDDPESYISRRHAQIIKQNDQFIFEDVGSANGSFVNGNKAVKGAQEILKNDDKLRLGKTEAVFTIMS